MPRGPRLVVPGIPHHVTQRGNDGRRVFSTAEDRDFYRRWLREYAERHGVRFWAYCLMNTHVHLIAVPARERSLSLVIGQAHTRHTRWMSRSQDFSGHLWASRLFSAPMDEPHLWAAIKYVELNPVRAGLVTDPADWRWSSAYAHVRRTPDPLLLDDLPLGAPERGEAWARWLREGVDEAMLRRLRRGTATGRPLGSREFLDSIGRVEEGA